MRGVRPIATRTSSATTRPPSERASTAFFSVRWAAVTSTPLRTETPIFSSDASTSSAANGSMFSSSAVRTSSVTLVPKPA